MYFSLLNLCLSVPLYYRDDAILFSEILDSLILLLLRLGTCGSTQCSLVPVTAEECTTTATRPIPIRKVRRAVCEGKTFSLSPISYLGNGSPLLSGFWLSTVLPYCYSVSGETTIARRKAHRPKSGSSSVPNSPPQTPKVFTYIHFTYTLSVSCNVLSTYDVANLMGSLCSFQANRSTGCAGRTAARTPSFDSRKTSSRTNSKINKAVKKSEFWLFGIIDYEND